MEDPMVVDWKVLVEQQGQLFSNVVKTNNKLMSEMSELRDQIELLQSGRKDLKTQIDVLKTDKQRLQERTTQLEGFDPIYLCLLDGDGCVFSQRYLSEGENGGKAAAADLKAFLEREFGGRGSFCTMLYMNLSGLRDYLALSGVCSPADFGGFVTGFNRSTELFSIVDCGGGKEAADAKIREMLKTFICVPQVKNVVFGGGHDGGYLSVLNSLRTQGHGHKLILLEYAQNAKLIDDLSIPRLSMPGLFLDKTTLSPRSPTPASQSPARPRSSTSGSASSSGTRTGAGSPLKAMTNGMYSKVVSTSATRPALKAQRNDIPKIDRTKALMYQTPSLCNDFYLHVCVRTNCTFSHEYDLSENDVSRLRTELKATPCKGKGCRGAADCWYKH